MKALITGITGQDGSFLAELLLKKGYEVLGTVRRESTFNTDRLDGVYLDPHEKHARMLLHYGDVSDGTGIRKSSSTFGLTRSVTLLRNRMCVSASINRSTLATSLDGHHTIA